MAKPNLDARLTAALAARAVGVTKQVFNYWRAAGHITPDEDGLYRYGDALQVEQAMRTSPRSSRGAARRRMDGSPDSRRPALVAA